MISDSTGTLKAIFGEITSIYFVGIHEGAAICSVVMIIMLLIWTCLELEKYTNSLTVSTKMKVVSLIGVASYCIMSAISAVLINNFIIGYISHHFCQIVYIIYFVTYNIGNICMYFIMSFHIESIFPSEANTILSIKPCIMNIHRIFYLIIPTVLWIFYLYLAFDHISVIQINKYKYCYAQQFNHSFWAQIVLISIAGFHIIFILSILFTVVVKSINNANIILREMSFKKHQFMKQLSRFIRKTTFLCLLSIISTVILICCSAYILPQMIFFLVLDGAVNSYCIICLLEIGDKFYLRTCRKLEKVCNCMYCLDKYLSRSHMWQKYDRLKVNDGDKYKPPTLTDSDTGFVLLNSVTITGNASSITPLTGCSNITPQEINIEESEEERDTDSLLLLHNTDSTMLSTHLELQSTIS